MMFPVASFDSIPLAAANDALDLWQHRMGRLERGTRVPLQIHGLRVHGDLVGVACTDTLIRERVGGGLTHMDRSNTVELSRLCGAAPWVCRVVLRLWRECVFPSLGMRYAISYQDADIHTGNTYRFDGWRREGYSHSGTDSRSGRKGRNKWIWVWERAA